MKIAVEGCAHGELEKIYETIQGIERAENIKIDLLICCGDFQSTRNVADLQTMAVPKKYRDMCSFYKYYSGELVAPLLTIFVGGNHEASNYLQELPYGGWVAPNIYYLGYAGVVRVNGVRIAGISGIYKGNDYLRGHFEFPPYTEQTLRSVYHVRQLEVFRLMQLSGEIDIIISHDWPRGIYNYGNKAQLLRFKPAFISDVESGQLGSRPLEELLQVLKPNYWFAAHLHCKFAAMVPHDNSDNDPETFNTNADDDDKHPDDTDGNDKSGQPKNTAKTSRPRNGHCTKFLALDKCLPKRRFLQVLDIEATNVPTTNDSKVRFEYDDEWLTVLFTTNHLISVKSGNHYMPGPSSGTNAERYNFTPTDEELQHVREMFGDLTIPNNFCRTALVYKPGRDNIHQYTTQPRAQINPQSREFCDKLGIDDPVSLAFIMNGKELEYATVLDTSVDSLTDTSLLDDSKEFSLNESNFSDTVESDSSNPLKRKSLTMAAPVSNEQKSPIPSSAERITENSEQDTVSGTASPSHSSSEEITQTVSIVSINDIHADQATPTPRKFKRRNENIYTKVDDEAETQD